MKQRMLRGELYIADDEDLAADFKRAQELLERYNGTAFAEQELRDRLLLELLAECGEGVHVRPPFHLEYGTRVSIGAGTFFNYDCLMLDVAPVTIGAPVRSPPASSSSPPRTRSTPSRGESAGNRPSRSSWATTS